MISRCETTIIAANAKLEGNLSLECKLHIDGEVIGQVYSSSVVVVAKSGKFDGKAICHKLIVTGEFIGEAQCDEIEILKTGKFIGKMTTSNLMIEPGAVFEGENVANKKQNSSKKKDEKKG
jgi:cytoskeletal protein CcmA (bactofilin family)